MYREDSFAPKGALFQYSAWFYKHLAPNGATNSRSFGQANHWSFDGPSYAMG
jgi:hypothetical protein